MSIERFPIFVDSNAKLGLPGFHEWSHADTWSITLDGVEQTGTNKPPYVLAAHAREGWVDICVVHDEVERKYGKVIIEWKGEEIPHGD